MIASAFPCDIVLNADDCPIKWSECAVAGTDALSADQIQIWDGSAFTTYIYQKYKSNNPNKFTDGPGWVNLSKKGTKANVKIDAGTGVWYARPDSATSGTLPEVSPIAK